MFEEPENPRIYARRLMQPTLCVRLSNTGEEFHLHKHQLKHKSGYFRGLLDSRMSEVQLNTVDLNLIAEASQAFHAITEYLYTDTYHAYGRNDEERALEAALVYVLADRFIMPELKARALNRLCDALGLPQSFLKYQQSTVDEWPSGLWGNARKKKKGKKKKAVGEAPIEPVTLEAEATAEALILEPVILEAEAIAEAVIPEPDPPIFSSANIQFMKDILYEDLIHTEDTKPEKGDQDLQPPTETPASSTKPMSPKPGRAADDKQAPDPDWDPRREGKLAFTKHLSQHLDYLRKSGEFKALLQDGSLNGDFMVDLLCTSIDESVFSM